ncbi:MAG TPA: restriction endonuclease subunit S [Dehalococcoidia bacterium]|nr:restriction endonuclease subunit S [Dehalococcoidia bacterium]
MSAKAGWTRVAFGEVVQLVRERTSDPQGDGFERYVGLEHIDPGELRIRRWGDVSDGTTFTNVFRGGQVLFGKRRAYQRKVAVADFDGICSGDIYVFEPKGDQLLPALLPFICQTDRFFEHAVGTSAGSLSPRTNWDSLAAFEFSLPPLDEQRRLAETLVAFDASREGYREVGRLSDRLRRSILLDAFRSDRGAQDRFPKHWLIEPASSVGEVQLGQQRHPKFRTGANVRPYLRVANVMDGWIDLTDLESMHFPESDLRKFELLSGDILLNEGQSTELVGRSAIYRGEIPGCCVQKTLIRFRCGPALVPEFAHAYFQHLLYTGQFASMVVQTTSMAHLTAIRFKAVPVPVPPLEEQRELASKVAAVATALSAVSERHSGAHALRSKFIAEALETR